MRTMILMMIMRKSDNTNLRVPVTVDFFHGFYKNIMKKSPWRSGNRHSDGHVLGVVFYQSNKRIETRTKEPHQLLAIS